MNPIRKNEKFELVQVEKKYALIMYGTACMESYTNKRLAIKGFNTWSKKYDA